MKFLTVVVFLCAISTSVFASDVHVNGYVNSKGTYVAPYERTAPNNTVNDNYTTKGNTNPYNGKEGTKATDFDSPSDKKSTTFTY